jgi:outer membrane receptor protein involved in Fe transport
MFAMHSDYVSRRLAVRFASFAFLAFTCALAPFLNSALAQVSTAAINGTIRDATGAVVPDANLVLKNVATGLERKTTSNSAGTYVVVSIPPGAYTLEAVKTGFGTKKIVEFTLQVNQQATFDLDLQVGALGQTVTVQAVGAEVQASTAELGAVVGERRIGELPLNGRNFTQLLALTPGVSSITVNGAQAGPFGVVGTAVGPSVNGQNNRSNFFMIDGVNNMGQYFGAYVMAPIIDTIEEFKVQSHNDEARFGGALGGIINVVTKSGTNKLHGTLWEYLRNDAFDARDYFLPKVTPFKQNQFGVSAGGPVVLPRMYNGRNRTFFMLGYQGFRFRTPSNLYARVPTAANLQGDLSDWPRQIYDPLTTRSDPAKPGQYLRDPLPRNQIPSSRIDQGLLAWAKAVMPAPVFTGNGTFNALNTYQTRRNLEEYTARVDQTIGAKDFLWFRYTGNWHDQSAGGSVQTVRSVQEDIAQNIGASWVHTFNPSTVLQVNVGRVTMLNKQLTRYVDVPENFSQTVGFADVFARNWKGDSSVHPGFNLLDFFSASESDYINRPSNLWQWSADVSKVLRGHTLRWGGELSQNGIHIEQHMAQATFDNNLTGDPNSPATTGSSVAAFLLNVPSSAQRRNLLVSTRWGGVMSFYFQDQWKVSPRLTVNLGLRYDRTFIPPYGREEDGNIDVGDMDMIRGVYVLQHMPAPCETKKIAPCIPTPGGALPDHVVLDPRGKLMHDSTDNWQPRVGLAYRIAPSTALRASFGRFFDNWAGVGQQATNIQGSWPSVDFLTGGLNLLTAQQPTPTVKGTNPFPTGGTTPALTPWAISSNYFDPFLKNPYSLQWNFGIQHQFNPTTILSLNYVGSGSKRLNIGTTYNVARVPGPGDPADRRPFPYMSPSSFDRSWGRSTYNGLQAHLEKRYASGFAYTVAYTWSKAIDIGCSGWFQTEGCAVQDPYNLNNDRGPAGFDLTHIFVANWLYELPFGPRKALKTGSRVANYVIGDWQFNGISTLQSGQPYTVTIRADIANTGNGGYRGVTGTNSGYMRPNVVGDYALPNPSPAAWFDRSAFAVPAQYTFGNLGRNRMRTDWIRRLDLSLFRQFQIGESKRLEFRAEAFNATNTPVFYAPVEEYLNPNFGRVTATRGQRQLQLGVKVVF